VTPGAGIVLASQPGSLFCWTTSEKSMGRNWLRLVIVRDIELSEVLYHEIGHHIHRVHKPLYEGKEDVADKWSRKLSSKFIRDRDWYLFPLVLPIALVLGLKKDIDKIFRKNLPNS
jgi:hypothetical protein